jgi:hypothetical protein
LKVLRRFDAALCPVAFTLTKVDLLVVAVNVATNERLMLIFVQATYDGPHVVGEYDYRMVFTTQVNVVPYTWPRGPCVDADDCYGKLV